MEKMKWKCRWFGHKWVPAFIKGDYSGKEIKFIGCFCKRCDMGYKELFDIIKIADKRHYDTYNESYFNPSNTKSND